MDFNLDGIEPPFEEAYKHLLLKHNTTTVVNTLQTSNATAVELKDLPLVDLGQLVAESEEDIEKCKREIIEAAKEWGFFQVVNHGIPNNVIEELSKEQVKMFREPLNNKIKDQCMNMNFSRGSYRWGTPSPVCVEQLSWSEAFHIPLTDLCNHNNIPSLVMKEYAKNVSGLALKLANILDEDLVKEKSCFLEDIGLRNESYVRLNRYPACPKYFGLAGILPHTDSDFITILYQDQVGGLQLVKDGKWIQVKPNPNALIVNIGDMFQARSTGIYRSVKHRVVANKSNERYSVAYFLFPSHDTVIQSFKNPPLYRKFTYGEYRQQIQEDKLKFGNKVGLDRFLLSDG